MVKGTEYAEHGVKKYGMQLLAQKKKSIERLAKELNLQYTTTQTIT